MIKSITAMIKEYFLFGLFLRILVMPLTGHWDLVALHTPALTISQDADIYNYYYTTYPPLTYYLLHLWQKIISPFSLNLGSWLNLGVISSFNNLEAFRNLFLLKAFYLPFDFLVGFLLFKISKNNFEVFKLWMVNPLVIYIVYMWGSIDIVPTALMLLSIYWLIKKCYVQSAFLIGMGSVIKIFPIILLPLFLTMVPGKRQKIISLVWAILPILITFFPYLTNPNFYKNVLFNPSSQSLFYARIPIGSYQDLSVYVLIFSLFFFSLIKRNVEDKQIMPILFFPIALFYIFSAFTPQWFLWGLPFFIYFYCRNFELRFLIKTVFFMYLIIVVLSDISLNIGIFAPLETTILMWPAFAELLNKLFNVNTILSVVRSVLSGALILMLYNIKKIYEKT